MSPSLVKLRDIAAQTYPREEDVRRILADSDINSASITFGGNSLNTWTSILLFSVQCGRLAALLTVVCRESPDNTELQTLAKQIAETGFEKADGSTVLPAPAPDATTTAASSSSDGTLPSLVVYLRVLSKTTLSVASEVEKILARPIDSAASPLSQPDRAALHELLRAMGILHMSQRSVPGTLRAYESDHSEVGWSVIVQIITEVSRACVDTMDQLLKSPDFLSLDNVVLFEKIGASIQQRKVLLTRLEKIQRPTLKADIDALVEISNMYADMIDEMESQRRTLIRMVL